MNFFIASEIDTWPRDLNSDFAWMDCWFGVATLAKNADPVKYAYAGYGIAFDSRSELPCVTVAWVKLPLFLELIWAHLCISIIRMHAKFFV